MLRGDYAIRCFGWLPVDQVSGTVLLKKLAKRASQRTVRDETIRLSRRAATRLWSFDSFAEMVARKGRHRSHLGFCSRALQWALFCGSCRVQGGGWESCPEVEDPAPGLGTHRTRALHDGRQLGETRKTTTTREAGLLTLFPNLLLQLVLRRGPSFPRKENEIEKERKTNKKKKERIEI